MGLRKDGWTEADLEMIRSRFAAEGASKALARDLKTSRSAVQGKASMMGLDAERATFVLARLQEEGKDRLQLAEDPDGPEGARRSRCRQLAFLLVGGPESEWKLLSSSRCGDGRTAYTHMALDALIEDGKTWFCRDQGMISLTAEGKRVLIGHMPDPARTALTAQTALTDTSDTPESKVSKRRQSNGKTK